MSLLPPSLLSKLARSRLLTLTGTPRQGIGERRSRAKGAGIEFADHRQYQPGDDIRYLDRHVYSRLGQHVVKQYHLYQQLKVTILVDDSASMGFGNPPKMRRAAQVAGLLGYVGLCGGDRVQLGALSGGRVRWYRPVEGARRAPALLGWLEDLVPKGPCDLVAVARASLSRLEPGGMLVLVSDLLYERVDEALAIWRGAGQDLVGVRVLAPEELEPERLGDGPARLLDIESGQEVEVALESQAYSGYREALANWSHALADSFYRVEGRLSTVSSTGDLESMALHDWRSGGLIT